ncbi:hypothetical protein FCH28_04860 [Streptomyces piniterrae]|uniref:Uncharacterized protein n=1 Tax=Streptomyces piniterrae TaxID=2571125 RepID=A0A4U0NR17_9ACTN|nr:hypothetical protein [Streptomyces piniterrae]TJZ56850.1 hypothetical protein FCH28_04860 [Streptomyces piniterrae]
MDAGMGELGMTNGLRWISEAYDMGYTVVLCEGISPEEMLSRMGFAEDQVFPLSRDQADDILCLDDEGTASDLEFIDPEDEETIERLERCGFLSRPESIVRVGGHGGWAYALEAFFANSSDEELLASLSKDTRVFALHCNGGKGFGVASFASFGVVHCSFEIGAPWDVPDVMPEELTEFVAPEDDEPDAVAFLRFLETTYGIYVPWSEAETEARLSAAFPA